MTDYLSAERIFWRRINTGSFVLGEGKKRRCFRSGQKGDIDNFPKVVLDGLVDAGIISTDARVEDLRVMKLRDESNPRTEIEVTAL